MFKIKALSSAVAAAALLLGVGAAQADTYTFSQPFDDGVIGADGGTLSGVFTGAPGDAFSILSLSFNGVLGGISHTNVSFTPITVYTGDFVAGDLTFSNALTNINAGAGPSGPGSLGIIWSAGAAAGAPYFGSIFAFGPTGATVSALTATDIPSMQVTPVPEPSTYLMMALGLGAVCFLARRRAA